MEESPSCHRRTNVIDPEKSSGRYARRLLKYALRGFRPAVPGFRRDLVRASDGADHGASDQVHIRSFLHEFIVIRSA